jgi:pimeloyl-ACP methyl ester carboxylesterase
MDVATVEVGGHAVAYRRAGSGPPLVLLHSGASDGRDWLPQLASLADEFDVIAWDAPGCGASEDPAPDARMADYADALAGLVSALGPHQVHLGGLSWGGGLALAVHQTHPAMVRSLVLVSAYAGWAGSLPPEEVAARVNLVRAELSQPPGAEWIDADLPTFFARPVPAETLRLVRSVMLDVRPAGALAMLEAFADADLRDALPKVDVPTLVLAGADDVRAPLPVAQALHAGIPGARLVVLPGVGHLVNLEAPEDFDREVRSFLRTV